MLLAGIFLSHRPIPPLGTDAPPRVFSSGRALIFLRELVGNGAPHPTGSAEGARVRDAIVKRLTTLGYSTELQAGLVCNDEGVCGNVVNVVATLGPVAGDADAVLLSAHYDSVPAGPGASDNGAGVATVIEIARILPLLPRPRHPVVLLLNEGEEAGLLGARLFLQEHPLSRRVKAAVNLEARGTSGASLMFETGGANAWAMRLYASAIPRPAANSIYYLAYKLLPNNTDFTLFKSAGYQGFNFAFIGNAGRYHTPLDTLANASPSSVQHQGENALAALLALANAENLRPPAGESVFFDVFARVLLAWPADLSLPAAVGATLLVSALAVILLRRRVVTSAEIIAGCAGAAGVVVSGVAVTAGLLALLIGVGKVPPIDAASWMAHPLPMTVAAAAVAFAAAGGVGVLLARRAGFWGFWTAAASLFAWLSIGTAAFIPAASFVFLAPALAAGTAALPCAWSFANARTPSGWAMDFAGLLPALAIFAAVLPLLPLAYTALGSLAWPISTLVLSVAAAALLPLLAAANRRGRQGFLMLAALTAVGGTALTVVLPTYSAEWPQRINFEYWLDADTGQATWLAESASGRLPEPIARAGHFDPAVRSRFPGNSLLRFHAPAPRLELAAPELTMTSRPIPAAHYELLLTSPRGAPEAVVIFPASRRIDAITVVTQAGASRVALRRLGDGAARLDVVGLSSAGFRFGVDAADEASFAVQVFDKSYGLERGSFLQAARPQEAASSQDGDITVVHRTVSLDPGAGR